MSSLFSTSQKCGLYPPIEYKLPLKTTTRCPLLGSGIVSSDSVKQGSVTTANIQLHPVAPILVAILLRMLANFSSDSNFCGWMYIYRPQTKLRKGNVFTSVCQDFCPRGRGVCIPACTGVDTPPPCVDRRCILACTGADTPPPADYYCSGRYASYWNAFL